MEQRAGMSLENLARRREDVEARLEGHHGNLSDRQIEEYTTELSAHRRELVAAFQGDVNDATRLDILVEIVRTLEVELIHLHNLVVDPSRDHKELAVRIGSLLGEISSLGTGRPSRLETLYYRGVLSMFAGDRAKARAHFERVCESEESDESSDVKYKSFVILGHLSHEDSDFESARELHDRSMEYSSHSNVTAQALALKALNSYALGNAGDALDLFESSLREFREDEPHYNEYFHRNALLFCGAIYFDRKDYARAKDYYEKVLEHVETASYDFFDANAQLGKIYFAREEWDAASSRFRSAVENQAGNENEYLLDTYFWLAKALLKKNEKKDARECLNRIVTSEVKYAKRPQAEALLARVS